MMWLGHLSSEPHSLDGRPVYYLRLKNSTWRSCFCAASRVLKVPRFLRFPVLGSFFCEYKRYLPDFSFRIILTLLSLRHDQAHFEERSMARIVISGSL